jgi:hypothetical protein
MNASLDSALLLMRLAFWRAAAAAVELANRHRQAIYRFTPAVPLLLAGAAAWILGRLLGELLRWVLG